MSANTQVLRQALDAIVKYPESHSQEMWLNDGREGPDYCMPFDVAAGNGPKPPCGTTLCAAGWIAFLNAPEGARLMPNQSIRLPNGNVRSISRYAQKVSALTDDQRGSLFLVAQNLGELTAMVEALEANPDADYDELCDAAGLDRDHD
jgi:hypothetical protein